MTAPSSCHTYGPRLEIVLIGAGLIGLAIALELNHRGASVTVIDHQRSLAGASIAAAGMLAADDPFNPSKLSPLSRLSIDRYPAFLNRIEHLSGLAVPFQTDATIQYLADGTSIHLAEHSIDPRQLAAALSAAIKTTSIQLLDHTHIAAIDTNNTNGMTIHLRDGSLLTPRAAVYTAGAWTSASIAALHGLSIPITPRKGQMLRVQLPHTRAPHEVHRSEHIYIVPRSHGPQAGTALIGATVEDAGFDTTVHAEDLDTLRARAAQLIPTLASKTAAPLVESWAGLRPSTPDDLPILGACTSTGPFIASGHYRNGILLAPATALVIADLLEGKPPIIDLSAFSPTRFTSSQPLTDQVAKQTDIRPRLP